MRNKNKIVMWHLWVKQILGKDWSSCTTFSSNHSTRRRLLRKRSTILFLTAFLQLHKIKRWLVDSTYLREFLIVYREFATPETHLQCSLLTSHKLPPLQQAIVRIHPNEHGHLMIPPHETSQHRYQDQKVTNQVINIKNYSEQKCCWLNWGCWVPSQKSKMLDTDNLPQYLVCNICIVGKFLRMCAHPAKYRNVASRNKNCWTSWQVIISIWDQRANDHLCNATVKVVVVGVM